MSRNRNSGGLAVRRPSGAELPRFLPRVRYELLACAIHGHRLLGTDVVEVAAGDGLVVHETGGARWHRCLRCDAWLPLPVPAEPQRQHIGDLDRIAVPLRGRPLRDRYVLRVIAIDRATHVLLFGSLATLIIIYAMHHYALNVFADRVFRYAQFFAGTHGHGLGSLTDTIHSAMGISTTNLYIAGSLIAAYGALEGTEMVGLWLGKRWAEYLTVVAVAVFIPYETYELIAGASNLKIAALLVNLAIIAYLLVAKRLFGLRGGAAAERREYDDDTGWPALRHATGWIDVHSLYVNKPAHDG